MVWESNKTKIRKWSAPFTTAKKYHQQLEEECASVGRITVCAMSPPRLADIGVLLQKAEEATRD